MSQTATRLPLASAQQLAQAVKDELAAGCDRIDVAGSVRRKAHSVGDLEMTALDKILETLALQRRLKVLKNGAPATVERSLRGVATGLARGMVQTRTLNRLNCS